MSPLLHLYRPITWRRGGRCVCLTDARDVSPREAALLVRLGWATWVGFPGDVMEPALRAEFPI